MTGGQAISQRVQVCDILVAVSLFTQKILSIIFLRFALSPVFDVCFCKAGCHNKDILSTRVL